MAVSSKKTKNVINKITGVSTTRTHRVNAGKVEAGKSSGFGTRDEKRYDLRKAFAEAAGVKATG